MRIRLLRSELKPLPSNGIPRNMHLLAEERNQYAAKFSFPNVLPTLEIKQNLTVLHPHSPASPNGQ
jgi:hypothetical protein